MTLSDPGEQVGSGDGYVVWSGSPHNDFRDERTSKPVITFRL